LIYADGPLARGRCAPAPTMAIMTPRDIQSILNVGAVVKVFFDRHTEIVLVLSIDPDGMLCRPVSAGTGGTSAEFWLAYDQISQIDKVEN
jgi:hypothetical protein